MTTPLFFSKNKTPKMIVEEIVTRRKLVRTWDCINVQQTPPVFRCTCLIEEENRASPSVPLQHTAEGHGNTKKDAEQCAAFKIIPKLVNAEELFQLTTAWEQTVSNETALIGTVKKTATADAHSMVNYGDVSDTDDDKITEDPIGKLSTVCARCKLPPAVFKDQPSVDPLTKKSVFTVTCAVDSVCSHQARRWKKQDAKKISAYRVLRDLESKGFDTSTSKRNTSAALLTPLSEEVTSSQEEPQEPLPEDNIKRKDETTYDTMETGPSTSSNLCSPAAPSAPSTQVSRKVPWNQNSDKQQAETGNDGMLSRLKRKATKEDGEHANDAVLPSSSSTLSKRKFELILGRKLTCFKSENCLRFVKDYTHVFQHLPPNSCLDEALIPREFAKVLHEHGGPVKLLEKSAAELNATLKFVGSSAPLKTTSENKKLVLLTIRLKSIKDFQAPYQQRQVVAGVGKDFQTAKEDAALNALKLFRSMMFSDDDDSEN